MAQERVKIVYFIGTLGVGGAEKHLLNVVRGLDRQRFSPQVCCLSEGGPLEGDFREAGCPVTIFGYKGLKPNKVSDILGVAREFYRMVSFLKKNRPDIVHCYLYWANIIGGFAARAARCPVIITSRRSLGYFKDGKPHYQWLENLTNRFTNIVTVNSKGVMADVLKRERLDPQKIRLIYNGVDYLKHQKSEAAREKVRNELGLNPGVPLITTVANLIAYKGHMDLLEAASAVHRRVPRAKFLLVGRDGGMEAELRKLISELGLEDTVIFAGPRSDIPGILSSTDIMVLPSHEEGFPNVVLEGMAAGLPLVVTDVGGNPEAVESGESGLVVPARAPGELAAAIIQLLSRPDFAGQLGQAARKRVETCFSLDSMIMQMEQMYIEASQTRKGMVK